MRHSPRGQSGRQAIAAAGNAEERRRRKQDSGDSIARRRTLGTMISGRSAKQKAAARDQVRVPLSHRCAGAPRANRRERVRTAS